ncbi:MAG: hypothetical protein SVR08_17010 [Spirochaetota bacterium]|nr:hypothetical protein [Spirochaetota bacterium]
MPDTVSVEYNDTIFDRSDFEKNIVNDGDRSIVDDYEIAGGGVIIESIAEAISFVREHIFN